MARFTTLGLLVCFGVVMAVSGQGHNWGVKVKCFVIQDTIVCPGCGMRTGATCPRRPKNKPEFESCEEPTTTTLPTTTEPPTTLFEVEEDTIETSEITKHHLLLYLYRFVGPHFPPAAARKNRTARSADDEDKDKEICRWNGDCPCPLICCHRGEGCPKRCVMGIKLHPHIGYG